MTEKPDVEIYTAITAMTKHIREYAWMGVWDSGYMPTDEEISARKAAVEAICDEIDALAERSGSEDVRFSDFDLLRQKVYSPDLNVPAPRYMLEDVQMAFIKAGRT